MIIPAPATTIAQEGNWELVIGIIGPYIEHTGPCTRPFVSLCFHPGNIQYHDRGCPGCKQTIPVAIEAMYHIARMSTK